MCGWRRKMVTLPITSRPLRRRAKAREDRQRGPRIKLAAGLNAATGSTWAGGRGTTADAVVAAGPPSAMSRSRDSRTARYMYGRG